MNRNARIAITAAIAVLLVGAGLWFFVLRSDAPEAVSLEGATAQLTTTTTAGETTTVPDTAAPSDETTTTTVQTAAAEGISGTWRVAEGSDSFVGYRVEEELANIGFTEAVGRTSGVDATLEIEGTVATAISVVADLTSLRSDKDFRDQAIKRQALETNDFPEATFVSTAPIDLGAVPGEGETITFEVVGDLTIHGVTNSVSLPMEGQLIGDTIVVVGSLPIVFADYDIDPPSAAAVLSVEDNGVMELQLFLTR